MTEPERLKLDTIQAPFGREIRMEELRYESGMRIVRMTIREGRRFTTLDLDPDRARQLANALDGWARSADS